MDISALETVCRHHYKDSIKPKVLYIFISIQGHNKNESALYYVFIYIKSQ